MSRKQKETIQAVKDVLAGERTMTDEEIRAVKLIVEQQRRRRADASKKAAARPRTTDMKSARNSMIAPRVLPGSFESKK
jgi:hypothetical protein